MKHHSENQPYWLFLALLVIFFSLCLLIPNEVCYAEAVYGNYCKGWQETSPLDTPIDSPGAGFVENGYIYCPGGWGDARGTFHYAMINADGSLGTWQATTSMPGNHHTQSSATSYNGVIYLVGGHRPQWWIRDVYYAVPEADGSISTWISTSPLPAVKGGSGAFCYDGYLYSTGGTSGYAGGRNALTEVLYAEINVDGSIDSWQTTTPLPAGRCYHGATAYNGYAYIVGGVYAGPTTTAVEVLYSPVQSNGETGAWQKTTPLPIEEGPNLLNSKIFPVDDYLYLCTGQGGNYRAAINADGTLGAWQKWQNIGLDEPGDYVGTYTLDPDTKHIYGLGGRLSDGTTTSDKVYYISLGCFVIDTEIDIKPGSDPNCFNNDGHGVIPVAILSDCVDGCVPGGGFDATQVDPATVEMESLTVRVVGKNDKLQAHIEDVNNDGCDDLVVQIEDQDGVFENGETEATITGNLYDGTAIKGTDTICIVP
ncbi:MAG: hypothetical protein C4B58_14320 [Deltaproteobacteria bacterium]|nr:MAG: hypothetical protein C4B58_14320 [Deltaproteobacteria bacterium]